MARKIITILLQVSFVVSLLYGCYLFHQATTYNAAAFMNFVPAAILFIASILMNIGWETFGGQGLLVLSQMDPITAFLLILASTLMLIGVFLSDDRFDQILGWSFSLATFVAGYEAGKVRQKSLKSKEKSVI